MNHDRFPLPGEQEHFEPAQYHLDPNDPEQAELARFYAGDTREPVQTLPEPVTPTAPRETGQLTGPVPERPAEQPVYDMPAQLAAYHRDFAANQQSFAKQRAQEAARQHTGDYLLAPPKPEQQSNSDIHEGRFGFRALRGAIRRMRQR